MLLHVLTALESNPLMPSVCSQCPQVHDDHLGCAELYSKLIQQD